MTRVYIYRHSTTSEIVVKKNDYQDQTTGWSD